ncbi:CocE/NonD family hydrolase [Streptomyces albus]|uniref:CocE/NonD family hydrolase n=3 Tax=Streptomyces albus TaxID=1888 RepID=A0A8H1QUJ4_9ACTN|nr:MULTISPECIES: CocE/NonD family hydrolase [Streptomyces]TGG86357.1 CocE/NonD family hydrolase [Streptomyces albus]UVN53297.1 CocE/NonD family hydrolase [Streptomyces albus]GHJ24408.1 hydrolase [Streptomyces albus]
MSAHTTASGSTWAPSSRKPPLRARLLRASWRGLPAKRHDIGWEPGLVVPAADGSPLVTDHYFPRAEGDFPTLLVRSPYGRGLPWSPMYGVLFAEQGFHVVLQSCRGTGGSGGTFHLWRNESSDAQATVAWLREQPWFDGKLGTVGPSYLGYVQWALAREAPPELKAMAVQVGLHDPYALFYEDGALRLDNSLAVGAGMTYQHQGTGPFLRAMLRLRRRVRTAVGTRPLRDGYAPALGGGIPWLDEVLAHPDARDAYWQGADPGEAAARRTVPTSLVTGWHDALVDQAFVQYARLRAAGCETALLVGPWDHTSALQQGWPEVFTESLAWLRAHLCADPSGLRPTDVRIHVGGGQGTWRDLDAWPGQPAVTSWFPASGGYLTRQPPTDSAPLASFRYDPADPTPSVGGPLLSGAAGSRDNTALEAREDVLTFTGPPLSEPVEVVGPVSAHLRVHADTGYADVFTRLCDVDPQGRSVNVCDGLGRLRPQDGRTARLTVPMSATAHRFAAGHRIRWQISGGAHPRYAPHPGTDAARVDATEFTPVRLTLHADSALLLPQGAEDGQEVTAAP